MKMQKYASYLMMTVLLTNSLLGVFTASADSLSTVQVRVNQIQSTDPLLPSGVSEQKGMFGTIIANVFDAAGKIKVEFLGNLVPGLSTNYVPRWNGTNLINSAVSDNGTTVVSSRPVQVNSNLKVNGTNSFYLQGNRLYGDNSSALYYYSNHTSASQMEFRDINNVRYGLVYGDTSGANFGLLDGDGNWSYLAAKDNYTEFRINNSSVLHIDTDNLYSSAQQETIGWNRTGNRYAYTDYVGDDTYTDYGLRILRNNGGPNTWSELSHRGTGDFVMQAIDAGTLKFRTNSIDRMIIAPTTGNIGVAQAPSATDKLAVTGNISATGDIKGNRICDNSGNCTALPLPAITNYWTVNGTNIYNNNSGNVGVGTSSPSYKLDISGAVRASQYIWNTGVNWNMPDDNSEMSFDFANASGNAYWHVWDPTHGSILAVRNNGNVGIGTSGPTGKLEVSGNRTNTINYANAISNIGGADIRLGIGTLAGTPNWGNWIQSLRTSDNASFELSINPNGGNVGIGTSSPGQKLDVAGDTRTNWLRLNGGYGLYSEAYGTYFAPFNSNYWYSRSDNGIAVQKKDGTNEGWLYHDGGGSFGLLGSDGGRSFRVWAGGGSELYGVSYANDFRPNIIYDRNDTSYYVDPNGDSRLNRVITGRRGVNGQYNSAQVQGIWSIGSSWNIDEGANTFGNQYGMVYSYQPNSGQGRAGMGHAIYWTTGGTVTAGISMSYGRAIFDGGIDTSCVGNCF